MIDEIVCSYCNERKSRVYNRMRGDQRIYIDNTTGKEWSGARCPECYFKYKTEYDAKRRLKKGHMPMSSLCVCVKCGNQYELLNGKSNKNCGSC
jgi:hypothetical protein